MFLKHFSVGENTYNNCLPGGVVSALLGQRGQVHIHHELVHTVLPSMPDQQAQVYWESFLSKGYSMEKEVYREPGCEFIAHPLVLTCF